MLKIIDKSLEEYFRDTEKNKREYKELVKLAKKIRE